MKATHVHSPRKLAAAVIAAAFGAMLAGCGPMQPSYPLAIVKYDEALIGRWEGHDPKDPANEKREPGLRMVIAPKDRGDHSSVPRRM